MQRLAPLVLAFFFAACRPPGGVQATATAVGVPTSSVASATTATTATTATIAH